MNLNEPFIERSIQSWGSLFYLRTHPAERLGAKWCWWQEPNYCISSEEEGEKSEQVALINPSLFAKYGELQVESSHFVFKSKSSPSF